ncbi:MAG TPA: hypothetical protein VN663_23070 [Ramlibacter sp.]|nr:hypothetical protein [Ramlibacter sp.]
MKLTESERGEAFEAMRRRQEMLRLDDHVPLPEWALSQSTPGETLLVGLFAALVVAALTIMGALVCLYGWRVLIGGG